MHIKTEQPDQIEIESIDDFDFSYQNDTMDFSDDNHSDNSWKTKEEIFKPMKGIVGKFGTISSKEYYAAKVPCRICARPVNRKGMAKHLATKHNIGKLCFECDYCELKFSFYWITISNALSFSGGNIYYDKGSISVHVKRHTENVTYNCEFSFCSKVFKSLTYKKAHEDRMHRKITNTFVCDFCAQSYVSQASDNAK